MNIEKQLREDHQIKLIVTIDPEPLKNAKQRGARKIAQRVRIPGFRPGKAPYQFVERYVGEGAIMEEALQILIDETYPKLIDETGIQPYGPGSLESIPSKDPLQIEFLVPLRPVVALGDYHTIRMPYEPPVVGQADVDQVLKNIREQRAATAVVDRPAQPGDQVYVKLSAARNQPAEGEQAEILKERRQLITIEASDTPDQDEWPFPGFLQLLVGQSKDGQVTHTYTFPAESPYESLRSITADFLAIIDEVRERNLPELNDEFVKTITKYETVEALRAAILEDLQHHRLDDYLAEYDDKIMGELLKEAVIHYPPQALDDETKLYQRQFERQLSQQNMELETYIKMRGVDKEVFTEQEILPVAKSRLERSLILSEVAKREDIKLDRAALENETTQTLNVMAQSLEGKERNRLSNENFIYSLTNDVAANMIIKQTWERLQAIAKGEEIPVSQAAPATEAENNAPEIEQTVDNNGTPDSAPTEEPAASLETADDQQPATEAPTNAG